MDVKRLLFSAVMALLVIAALFLVFIAWIVVGFWLADHGLPQGVAFMGPPLLLVFVLMASSIYSQTA